MKKTLETVVTRNLWSKDADWKSGVNYATAGGTEIDQRPGKLKKVGKFEINWAKKS